MAPRGQPQGVGQGKKKGSMSSPHHGLPQHPDWSPQLLSSPHLPTVCSELLLLRTTLPDQLHSHATATGSGHLVPSELMEARPLSLVSFLQVEPEMGTPVERVNGEHSQEPGGEESRMGRGRHESQDVASSSCWIPGIPQELWSWDMQAALAWRVSSCISQWPQAGAGGRLSERGTPGGWASTVLQRSEQC